MGRVALIGENSIEYINALLDIWNSGNCAVLIDWRIPFQTAVQMMVEASVYECLIEKKQYDKVVEKLPKEINFIVFERKIHHAELLPRQIYDKFEPNYRHSEAVVLYSSGTTGKSKGVILSHFAVNTNADSIIDYMNPTSEECIYIAKTLSHSSTLTGELVVALKAGMKVVIGQTIAPPRYILNNIAKFDVSIICLNPKLILMLANEYENVKYNISNLKTIYVSGSILSDKVYAKVHKIFSDVSIYNVYGLSEAGPRVTAQRVTCCKSNSVGKPIKGISIAIVTEEGEEVSLGERGIIHVNTLSRYSGYVKGEATRQSLYRGWLNTGDVGYFDENHELHIVDRIDDMIILDSHKIYPYDIEKYILKYADIEECVIVLVNYRSENVLCCLYSGQCEMPDDIVKKLNNNLITYEIPKYYIKTDLIPKNLNGKVILQEVKQIIIQTLGLFGKGAS